MNLHVHNHWWEGRFLATKGSQRQASEHELSYLNCNRPPNTSCSHRTAHELPIVHVSAKTATSVAYTGHAFGQAH